MPDMELEVDVERTVANCVVEDWVTWMIRPWLAGQLLHYLLHHDDLVHGSGEEGREGGRKEGRGILCQSCTCMQYPVYVHVHTHTSLASQLCEWGWLVNVELFTKTTSLTHLTFIFWQALSSCIMSSLFLTGSDWDVCQPFFFQLLTHSVITV